MRRLQRVLGFGGRVASVMDVGTEPGHCELGIEFLALAPEDDLRLQSYIESLAKADEA